MTDSTSDDLLFDNASDETMMDAEPDNRLSPFGALFGVTFRPRATFQRMRKAERGHWWLVIVLAIVALALSTVATVPIAAAEARAAFEEQREQFEDLDPDQLAQIEQSQAIFTSQAALGGIGFATGLIGLVIGLVLRSSILFALGAMFGGRAEFKQVFRMGMWTGLPDIFRIIISAIAVVLTGQAAASGLSNMFTSTEVAEMSPVILAFLSTVDLYRLWGLILIAVGLVATYRISRGKSLVITILWWLLTLILTLGVAAGGAALGSAFGA